MKKTAILICITLLLFSLTACGNAQIENNSEPTTEKNNPTVEIIKETPKEEPKNEVVKSNALPAGEIYNAGDLQYHILGVRIQDNQYLTIKMEILNTTNESIMFSTMEKINLTDNNGNEVDYAIFGPKEGDVNVTILGGNKVVGEIPFEFEELKDSYILSVGEFFSNFKPAFEILNSDIDKTFEVAFESSGVTSDFSINDTIASDYLSFTITSATISPTINRDRDGKVFKGENNKAFLKVDFTIENNNSENINFLYSFFVEAFEIKGNSLDFNEYLSRLDSIVNANSSIEGFIIFDCEKDNTEFYTIITPDIRKQNNKTAVIFNAEQVDLINIK